MSPNVAVIAEYREAKKKVEELAAAARQQMVERYTALLNETEELKKEFLEAFAAELAPAAAPQPVAAASTGPKIGGLRRSLASALKRGDAERYAAVAAEMAILGVPVEQYPTADARAEMPIVAPAEETAVDFAL